MAALQRLWSRYFFILCLVGLMLLSVGVVAQSDGEGATLQNPVINMNFPDPFILEVEDTYYAYSTISNSRNVPVARSDDLVNWQFLRDAMPALPRWVRISHPDVWAPEVLHVDDDQFVLYYTARHRESGRQCIGAATSDSPVGPFRDQSEAPFICQVEQGGSIDASPFRDEDGTLYLYWKNDGNCCMQATYIYVQELAPDGLSLVGEPVQIARNDEPWEGPVVEAPTMWRQDDSYYLFYTGNEYLTERYAVGYAVCESPLGPCEDAEENPILVSDLESQPLVLGPGHQTVIEDEAGDTWIIYHIWQISNGRMTSNREVWFDRLEWEDGRPVVVGPTRDEQPAPNTDDE